MTTPARAASRRLFLPTTGPEARAGATQPRHAGVRSASADDTESGDAPERTSAELWLYGVVGGWWYGFSSDSVAYALRQIGEVDDITVRLDSPGGSAIQGIAIANLLANHPATVRVVVDGLAASAASQIAIAGDHVVMSPGSQMMLHDAWLCVCGNEAELRSEADWIGKQSRNYAETYAHRAPQKTAEEWREVMLADGGRGTWYTAAEAVAVGLADEVANIASTTPPPPEPVVDDEDDELAAAADLASLHPSVRATWTDRTRALSRGPKPPTASADGNTHPTEGSPAVAFSDEQINQMRTQLGVAEDADEATILAALTEALDEQAEPTSAGVPEGHVAIPAARLADLEAGAAAGVSAATALRDMECAALLDANRAKFLPASRAGWEAEFARNPEAVREHFASAQDLIPVSEIGHATEPDTSEDAAFEAAHAAVLKQQGITITTKEA